MRDNSEYLSQTEEAIAVRIVRANLKACNNSKWVHIIEFVDTDDYSFIVCELFNKKMYPKYPSIKKFSSKEEYYKAVEKITYDVSHEDIELQKSDGVEGPVYRLNGIFVNDSDEFVGNEGFKLQKVLFLGVGEPNYWAKKEEIRIARKEQRERELVEKAEKIKQDKIVRALAGNSCMKCKFYRKEFSDSGHCSISKISGSSYVAAYHIPKKDCFEAIE